MNQRSIKVLLTLLKKDIAHHKIMLLLWSATVLATCLAGLILSTLNLESPLSQIAILAGTPVSIAQWILFFIFGIQITQQEQLSDKTSFWIAKPVSGRMLLMSKLLFVSLILFLPLLLSRLFFASMKGADCHLIHTLWIDFFLLPILLLSMPLFLGAATRTWAQVYLGGFGILNFCLFLPLYLVNTWNIHSLTIHVKDIDAFSNLFPFLFPFIPLTFLGGTYFLFRGCSRRAVWLTTILLLLCLGILFNRVEYRQKDVKDFSEIDSAHIDPKAFSISLNSKPGNFLFFEESNGGFMRSTNFSGQTADFKKSSPNTIWGLEKSFTMSTLPPRVASLAEVRHAKLLLPDQTVLTSYPSQSSLFKQGERRPKLTPKILSDFYPSLYPMDSGLSDETNTMLIFTAPAQTWLEAGKKEGTYQGNALYRFYQFEKLFEMPLQPKTFAINKTAIGQILNLEQNVDEIQISMRIMWIPNTLDTHNPLGKTAWLSSDYFLLIHPGEKKYLHTNGCTTHHEISAYGVYSSATIKLTYSFTQEALPKIGDLSESEKKQLLQNWMEHAKLVKFHPVYIGRLQQTIRQENFKLISKDND